METVHAGLADQAPGAPDRDDRGRGRAEDPVHERDPGRDRRDRGRADRVARDARRAARALRPHPGGDPPELRARTRATTAASRRRSPTTPRREYWRTGMWDGPHAGRAGVGVRGDDRGHEAADRRDAAADARRRDPGSAEPVGLVGRARARRRHRPRRTERQRRPHLARAPVPVADRGAQAPAGRGRGAVRAAVRVSGVHRPGVDLAAGDGRDQAALLVVHPAPRLGPPGRRSRSATTSRRGRWRAAATGWR